MASQPPQPVPTASKPHILFLLSSRGHDPTELALPALLLSRSGFQVSFATSDGEMAEADQKLLERGWFGLVWGAGDEGREAYEEVTKLEQFRKPESWESKSFDILQYDVIVLPGGHDKPIRRFLESPTLHTHLAKFWPYCSRSYCSLSTTYPADSSKPGPKVVGAICHGALCLAFTKSPATGNSLLKGVHSTTLPRSFERTAWYGSQLWGLGDYYRTYGPEGRWCADDVVSCGARYVEGPMSTAAFVCADPEWRYVSARFPGDAKLFAEKLEEEVRSALALR